MYKGYEKKAKKNIGIYFKEIINYIKNKKDIYEQNIINCVLNIDEKKENVVIFKENENNKNEIKDNIYVFLNNDRVDIENEGDKWKIEYNFEKPDKYNIKIIFKINLTNLNNLFEECNEIEYLDLSNFNTKNVTNMEIMNVIN